MALDCVIGTVEKVEAIDYPKMPLTVFVGTPLGRDW